MKSLPLFLRWTAGLMLIVLLAASAQAAVLAEAYLGQPYGVGRVEIDLPVAALPPGVGAAGVTLDEKGGRLFYPATDIPALLETVRDLLGQSQRPALRILGGLLDRPPKITIYFLFRGGEPLNLILNARAPHAFQLAPAPNPAGWQRLIGQWWRVYTSTGGLLQPKADYPPILESYLQPMLAGRLRLPLPAAKSASPLTDQLQQDLGVILDTEDMRNRLRRARMLGELPLGQKADLPVPPPTPQPPLAIPEVPAGVVTEPLALRVPEECLYIRFGNFTNFLWFQDTMERWGGDLRNLVALRGLDYGLNKHFQHQIVLQQTALSRLLGETSVADAAIVASDTFMAEGAAMGILFLARNNRMLSNDILRQRQEALKSRPGSELRKLTIQDHEVTLLTSPDGTVRSYYAADGDYHLVTTSEFLIHRFLETGRKVGALADAAEFRFARTRMPTSRNDTIFIYVPAGFFRTLAGPHYRVETLRRLQALADIELVEVARRLAAAEGTPADSIAQLVSSGLLPSNFGPRPDGSSAVIRDGQVVDSLRGKKGYFIPVPDVPIEAITAAEAEQYQASAAQAAERWGQVEPILVGMQRKLLIEQQRDQVHLDVEMTPLNPARYASLSRRFGPADNLRRVPIPGDAVAAEWITPQQRMFGAIRDRRIAANGAFSPEFGVDGLPIGPLRDLLYGYVGYQGSDPGLFAWLQRRISTPPDAAGYSRSPSGLWRRQFGQFTLFSFHPDILAQVSPQLRWEPAARPAQIRVQAQDLSQAEIAPAFNRLARWRSRQTTMGNIRLLEAMTQQLHLPPDRARESAEELLGARLVCPLGGKYVYEHSPEGSAWWTSTALVEESAPGASLPLAPPLNWFRGMDLDAQLLPQRLEVHTDLLMQLPPKKPAPTP